MVPVLQLWLPIVLSAVGVFVASAIIHMMFKFWHQTDYRGFPNENDVRVAVGKSGIVPGMYMLPYCKPEEMKSPEFQEKMKQGPVAFVILRRSGMYNMGKSLGQWFVFCLLVALFAGYIGGSTLAAGTAGMQVFRVVATAAFMGFGFGAFPWAIWWGQPWGAAVKDIVDGLVYGIIIGAVFACLWPH